jgi:hypothetical protein
MHWFNNAHGKGALSPIRGKTRPFFLCASFLWKELAVEPPPPTRNQYAARDMALAGAIVTLAQDGSVRIERGFVRAEDEPESKAKAVDEKGKRPARGADGLALVTHITRKHAHFGPCGSAYCVY